jgi:hypothetical protein
LVRLRLILLDWRVAEFFHSLEFPRGPVVQNGLFFVNLSILGKDFSKFDLTETRNLRNIGHYLSSLSRNIFHESAG